MRSSVKLVLGGLLCLLMAVSRAQDVTPISDMPTSTAIASLTPTLSPISTYTVTFEPTMTKMDTVTPFSTVDTAIPSPILTATLESSLIEVTPETTSELPTAFFTVTSTTQLPAETVEPTATVISSTLTLTPGVSPTATLAPEPTETVEIAMLLIAGRAFYQNHGGDNSGIQISIFDSADNLIGITQTDANGHYTLNIPGQSIYQLVIEASLHQRVLLLLSGSETLSDTVLAGGDLDADGCIGQLDLDFFMSQFNSTNFGQADITGDGVIDAADFAILAGNYENNCPAIEPTPTANSLPVLPIPSSTVVADAILETPIQVPTDVELTLSPHFAPTLVINLTETLSFESTPEET